MKFLLSVLLLACLSSYSFAGEPPPEPTPMPSNEEPVTIKYSGKGSANFNEVYTQERSGQCSLETYTANEDVTGVEWKSTWKKVRPIDLQYMAAKSPSFSGKTTRKDSSNCSGIDFPCTSDLSLEEGYFPELKVKKSGKISYIVTINAEQDLRGKNPSSSTCFNSSVFDNAITEGMNNIVITALRIKLTRATSSTTTRLKFAIKKSFDCTDPAKVQAFLSSSCTLTTDLSGTVVLTGKWKAKLLK